MPELSVIGSLAAAPRFFVDFESCRVEVTFDASKTNAARARALVQLLPDVADGWSSPIERVEASPAKLERLRTQLEAEAKREGLPQGPVRWYLDELDYLRYRTLTRSPGWSSRPIAASSPAI